MNYRTRNKLATCLSGFHSALFYSINQTTESILLLCYDDKNIG